MLRKLIKMSPSLSKPCKLIGAVNLLLTLSDELTETREPLGSGFFFQNHVWITSEDVNTSL